MKEIIKMRGVNMETINDFIIRAKNVVGNTNKIATYKFNDISLIINKTTNAKLLIRDYNNASYLGLKSVGPASKKNYSIEEKKIIERAKIIEQIKFAISQSKVNLDNMKFLLNQLK